MGCSVPSPLCKLTSRERPEVILNTHLFLQAHIGIFNTALWGTMQSISRVTLRKELQCARHQLSKEQVEHYSQSISERLLKESLWIEATHIALYASHQNEVATDALIKTMWQAGKKAYLPMINEDQKLTFALYTPSTLREKNRLGILEPVSPTLFDAANLDIVIVPLVGFDIHKNRLGMGAGHYDRTFAFLRDSHLPSKPLLIGLAYEIQKTDKLDAENWDIPLDYVITEKALY
jgi:5-formyltetrahydrofolate cyclo-ligase